MYSRNSPIIFNDTSGNQSQIEFWQSKVYWVRVTPTYATRGFPNYLNQSMTGVYRSWTMDYLTEIQVGHLEKPQVLLKAGETTIVGPETRAENLKKSPSEKAMAEAARKNNQYARTGEFDNTPAGVASKGKRYPAAPVPEAYEATSFSASPYRAIGERVSSPQQTTQIVPASVTTAQATTPVPTIRASDGQYEMPWSVPEQSKIDLNFDKKPRLGPSSQLEFNLEFGAAKTPAATPAAKSAAATSASSVEAGSRPKGGGNSKFLGGAAFVVGAVLDSGEGERPYGWEGEQWDYYQRLIFSQITGGVEPTMPRWMKAEKNKEDMEESKIELQRLQGNLEYDQSRSRMQAMGAGYN